MSQSYPANIVEVLVNASKLFSGRLSSEDKETHIETVLFAMQNLDNGEVTQWHNTKDKTSGFIKIILTRPVQGGYCREFFSRINKDGSYKDYHESGCRTIDSQFWTFSGQ
jgi:surface antigen